MATIIKQKDRKLDKVYEPPLVVGFGIDSTTVKNPGMVMGYTTGSAGGRNQRHYHINTAAGIYVVKGRIQMFLGPDHEMKEVILEEGDFVYIPKGEIHGGPNLTDTAVVFCYSEVSSKEEAGTVYMEPPHGD